MIGIKEPTAMGEIPARSAVCALYDGDYHLGVGCLVNSLYRNGFRGTVWVGYRGPLPPWAQPVQSGATFDEFIVCDGCRIRFVELDIPFHIAQAKADFMLTLFAEHCADVDTLFYFDADSVIKCHWSFFETWAQCGVALCICGCYPLVPSRHPWRVAWCDLAESAGFSCRDISYYFASGFVAVPARYKALLEAWAKFIRLVHEEWRVSPHAFKLGDRTHPFACPDQDTLNVAIMATDVPLSILGPEGMDIVPGGYVMSQIVTGRRPWRTNYLRAAMRAEPPTTADKMYWHYADGPIQFCSKSRIALQRAQLKLASAIGRFYRRS